MKVCIVFLALLVCVTAVGSQASPIPIADAKEIGQNGRPVKYGQSVTVSGIVTVENGTFSTRDLDVHIQDETAGLNLSLRNGAWFGMKLGDSVVVTGTVDQEGRTPRRNNTKVTLQSVEGVTVVGRSGVPAPQVVTAATLAVPSTPPLEVYEGLLVRVEGLTIDPADWPAAGTEKYITATDATGSLSIRLDRDTDMPGSEPPGSPFIAIGVIIQDSSNPLTGYHLWPRSRYKDLLETGNGSGIADVSPEFVETDETSFDLDVMLEGNGVDAIVSLEIVLPLDDGWGWDANPANLSLSGPGLENATYEVTAAGVIVHSAEVVDHESYGAVRFEGVTPPPAVTTSEIEISTSIDGEVYEAIALNPTISTLLPLPDVVVNEVFPDDGTASESNAFIELRNRSDRTAYLEGFRLSDLATSPYCDPAARFVFGGSDTIPAGGYLVVAESQVGFSESFDAEPDLVADISPLGRLGGEGASVGGVAAYEVVALWRGEISLGLIDYCEYKSAFLADEDLCAGLGGSDDAYPVVPPVGYSLARDEDAEDTGASALDFVMSSEPTPGAVNVAEDNAPPYVFNVVPHSQDVIEVYFDEPCDSASLADISAYEIDGEQPLAIYTALTLQKVVLLFEGFAPDVEATVTVKMMKDVAGNVAENLIYDFETSYIHTTRICEVQEYDTKGYSPLLGEMVTIIGFVTVPQGTFQPSYNSIYIQGLDGCGVNVFSYDPPSPNPGLGDLVRVTGEVEEYVSGTAGATTEIYMGSPMAEVLLSTFYPELEAVVMKTGEIGIEDNEGKFIATEGAIISANEYGFYVNDGSGGMQVYQNYTDIDYTQFKVGMYVRVQGVILQYDRTLPFLDGYELVPRWDSDIEIVDGAYPGEAVLEVEPRVFCPSCGEDGFVIKFATPSTAQVTLRIFDGKGRLVATLFSGTSVGASEKVWNGVTATGEPVPPGLYICLLDSIEAGTGRKTTDSAPIVVGVELK